MPTPLNDNDNSIPLRARINRKRKKQCVQNGPHPVDERSLEAKQKKDQAVQMQSKHTFESKAIQRVNLTKSVNDRRRRPPPQPSAEVFQFEDDKTGRKLIHPAALRYSLKLVEEELQSTTKSVAQSLLEHDELVSAKP